MSICNIDKDTFSIPDIDNLSIQHIDKSIFVVFHMDILYIHDVEKNFIVFSTHMKYIANINHKHNLYIFM